MIGNRYLAREATANETYWHKWNTLLSVRLIDGTRSTGLGQLWRRRTVAGWEYQQDPETDDEYYHRVGY